MLFDNIRDQARSVAILKKALENERIPTAYLFTGQQGCGRMQAAIALSASLNCEKGIIACGTCHSCKLYASNTHPDLHIIRVKDGKRMIVIEQVREEILGKAYLMPLQGRSSTFIVDDAHLMNTNASNAFLKTLEEPSDTSRFVLLASGKDAVLPTIASRCQVLAFGPLGRNTVRDLLIERGIDEQRANLLAAMARGSMTRALAYHEADTPEKIAEEFKPLSTLHENDAIELLNLSQRWGNNRDDALGVLEFMAQWYRDLMILAEGGPPDQIIHVSQMATLENTASRIGGSGISSTLESVEDAREALQQNANVQLTLDNLLLTIKRSGHTSP